MSTGMRAGGLALIFALSRVSGMTEEARLSEYNRRKLRWPPLYSPNTPGWVKLMERREQQIMAMSSSQSRWDAWNVLVASSSLVKNFTENGFAKVRAPESVNKRLSDSLRKISSQAPCCRHAC